MPMTRGFLPKREKLTEGGQGLAVGRSPRSMVGGSHSERLSFRKEKVFEFWLGTKSSSWPEGSPGLQGGRGGDPNLPHSFLNPERRKRKRAATLKYTLLTYIAMSLLT